MSSHASRPQQILVAPQAMNFRHPTSSLEAWGTSQSGTQGDHRSISRDRQHQASLGSHVDHHSQEIHILPGNICFDYSRPGAIPKQGNPNHEGRHQLHGGVLGSALHSTTASSTPTPRDHLLGSHSTRENPLNFRISEPRVSNDYERGTSSSIGKPSLRKTNPEDAGSSTRSTLAIGLDLSSPMKVHDNFKKSDESLTLAYSSTEFQTKELIQMKEMHALLLHRECQSLASRVVKLEKELAAALKAPLIPAKILEDKSTSTDISLSEYSSVQHCTTCSCQDNDQIAKCNPLSSRLLFQRRQLPGDRQEEA